MMKNKTFIFISLFMMAGFFAPVFAQAVLENPVELNFFYSATCPHCIAENKFLDEIQKNYPEVKINRYLVSDPKNTRLKEKFLVEYGAEKYGGLVPLTFIGKDYFLGFDNDAGIGRKIKKSIEAQIKAMELPPVPPSGDREIYFPFMGNINTGNFSLPALAITLGLLDGVNVCSLGALILILGLVMALGSRKKIIIFGGTYILTTAVVYGALITLWYQLFGFLNQYLRSMEIAIAVISFAGSIYFFKEFLKFRKQGPACDSVEENSFVAKSHLKLQEALKKYGSIAAVVGSIIMFAAVITVIEFPCSAAVPVVFAGILSSEGLSLPSYIFHISLFLIFYMLDEIIIFGVAVYKMSLWFSSPKFTTWAVLVESILLFALGAYYLIALI